MVRCELLTLALAGKESFGGSCTISPNSIFSFSGSLSIASYVEFFSRFFFFSCKYLPQWTNWSMECTHLLKHCLLKMRKQDMRCFKTSDYSQSPHRRPHSEIHTFSCLTSFLFEPVWLVVSLQVVAAPRFHVFSYSKVWHPSLLLVHLQVAVYQWKGLLQFSCHLLCLASHLFSSWVPATQIYALLY